MTGKKDELSQVIDRIQGKGPFLLTACFRDPNTIMDVVSHLPYVTVEGEYLTPRPGTDAQAVGNVVLRDGTKGFTLVTGGNLTPDEARIAMALLTESGEDQVFAGPGIGRIASPRIEPGAVPSRPGAQMYYVRFKGKDEGPYSVEQITEMLASLKIGRKTLCRPADGSSRSSPLESLLPSVIQEVQQRRIEHRSKGTGRRKEGMPLDFPTQEQHQSVGTQTEAATRDEKESELAKAYWEVKSENGRVHTYTEEAEIVEAILRRDITPDQESRHFGAPDQSGKRTETKWKRVEQSLVRSSFAVRVLFQPVWAHTIRGAGIGAALGIIFWLASGVFFFVIQGVNLAAGVVFAVFLYGWCRFLLPKRLKAKPEEFIGRKVLWVALVALGFSASIVGLGETLKGVFIFGLQGQIGAHLAGALAGVFPGMILGTLVGLARQGKLRRAPTAQPESRMGVVVKGLIIPSILFVCITALYITFMPELAEYLM